LRLLFCTRKNLLLLLPAIPKHVWRLAASRTMHLSKLPHNRLSRWQARYILLLLLLQQALQSRARSAGKLLLLVGS
jgi:hypothetical protein